VTLLTSFDAFDVFTWTGLGGDGNCSTRANWDHNSLPESASKIVFHADYDTDAAWDAGCTGTMHTLTVQSGYAGTVTLGTDVSVSSGVTLAGGTFDTAARTLSLSGSFLNNGGMLTGNGTVQLNGVNQMIGGTADTTFYNLAKSLTSADTLTFAASRTITVQNDTTLAGTSESARLSLRSTSAGTQWNINPSAAGTRTIQYVDVQDSNNANETVISCELGCVNSLNNANWTFPVVGYVYAADGVTALPNVTVALVASGTNLIGTADTDGTGLYKINLGNTILESGDILTLYLDGEIRKAVTVTVTDGVSVGSLHLVEDALTVRHESTGPVTVATLAAADDSGDGDIAAIYAVSGNDLALAPGKKLRVNAGDTFSAAGTISAAALDILGNLNGSGAITAAGNVSVSGRLAAETTLDAAGDILVSSDSLATEGAVTANDVRVKNPGQFRPAGMTARDFNMQGTFTPGGSVSVRHLTATGTLALGNHSVRATGNWRTPGGTITGTSTITLAGTGSQTIEAAASTLPSVILSGTGGTWTMSGALTTGTNLTVGTGRTLVLNEAALTVPGTLTNYGQMKLTGTETTSGFTNDTAHGTLAFTGNGSYSGLAALTSFHNLTLSGAGTWNLASATTVNGNLAIQGATLVQNTKNVSVGGSWTDTGGIFTKGGTVTFTGSGTIAEDDPFDHLVIQSALEDVTVEEPLSVSGSLVLRTGRLKVSPDTNPQITLAGDWENEQGNFSAGMGTVVLSGGDQAMSGSTLFWNLEKWVSAAATWTFGAADTQAVSGTWTARGAAGQFLRLRSSITDTQWKINPTAYDIGYIDVQDSNNIGDETILASDNAVNSGGNTNWAFPITVTVKTKSGDLAEAGKTVALSVDGAEPTTEVTNGSSVAVFTTVSVESGSLLAMWLSGGTDYGMLVTRTDGTSLAFTLYEDTITIEHQVGSNLTNGDLLTASMSGAVTDINALYTMSGSAIIGAEDMTLRIEAGSTLSLTEDLTAHDFDINGTFEMNTFDVTVTGSWDAADGAFSGTNTVTFESEEEETITVNNSAFNNVVFSISNDPTQSVGTWRTVDNFTVNGNQYVQNAGTNPGVPPVMSTVTVTPIYDKVALVNWETDVSASSKVVYGTQSDALTLTSTSASGSHLNRRHTVTMNGLTANTTYYVRAVSSDYWGNTTTGSLLSFTTLNEVGEAGEAGYEEGKMNAGGGGGKPYDECTDMRSDPLVISDLAAKAESGSQGVTVTWTTNHKGLSHVQYGVKSTEERMLYSLSDFVTAHTMEVTNLQSGTEYLLKAASVDQCGNVGYSQEITVTSEGVVGDSTEHAAAGSEPPASSENEDILARALQVLREMAQTLNIAEFKRTLIAQNAEMREIAELLPGPFMSGEPKVAVTDTTATITWVTDEAANSMVAWSPAAGYREDADYQSQVGDPDTQTADHQVTITGLSPGETYHYQVKSETTIGTRSASKDFSFTTQKKRLNIDNYSFKILSPDSALFTWETNAETTSRVTFIPYRGNELNPTEASTVTVPGYTVRHEVTATALEPGTVYSVEIAGKTVGGTEVSQVIPHFSTSPEKLAPVISRVKADVAISPGKEAAIQMIVTWETNKRATSRVRYQQGVATDPEAELANASPLEGSFGTMHTVILTGLAPGTVYSFQAESVDYESHVSLSKTFTVLTPRQQESIIQVITKEFESTFGWMGLMKGR
jgi:hypothetical protein